MALVTSKVAVSQRNSFSASKPMAIKSLHGVHSPPLDSDLMYSLSGAVECAQHGGCELFSSVKVVFA